MMDNAFSFLATKATTPAAAAAAAEWQFALAWRLFTLSILDC